MVNASLNWASIVGIVLAVGGAMLYFMRSFKPALARDYDVFFAAIGLLCGGILFFQGWRLDPILQFGQFLLAATTVFFAYESVRLRGVSTEQARRSAYFDDEPAPARGPAGGLRGGDFDSSYDRFDEPQPLRRRFRGSEFEEEEEDAPERDFYRPRRPSSRAAIPEQAASRRRGREETPSSWGEDPEQARRMARFGNLEEDDSRSRPSFGERRNLRQDQRRGSRPTAADPRDRSAGAADTASGTPMRRGSAPEDAAFAPSRGPSQRTSTTSSASAARNIPSATNPNTGTPTTVRRPGAGADNGPSPSPRPSARPPTGDRPAPRSSRPRDNNSRFDD